MYIATPAVSNQCQYNPTLEGSIRSCALCECSTFTTLTPKHFGSVLSVLDLGPIHLFLSVFDLG